MAWDMAVGDDATRTSIQERHRGSLSRGISAPARGSGLSDIMLWWRPERGEAFGYADGWTVDGDAFYFSGTGQEGDQDFRAPYTENGRVRDHAEVGDRLRLLRYVGKNLVRYMGELRLDPDDPWQWRDAPDRLGDLRKVIQFRMLPVDQVLRLPDDPAREALAPSPATEPLRPLLPPPSATDVEPLGSTTFQQLFAAQRVVVERRELQLVYSFREWLSDAQGVQATGLRIPYTPEGRNLRADLFVSHPPVLIEAKSSAAREKVRLAVGQLLDYRRWITPLPRMCVLVPTRPPQDMLTLLDEIAIGAAWPTPSGFEVRPAALFVI